MHLHKTQFEKKPVLWGTTTWSEMGKQNLKAKTLEGHKFTSFCNYSVLLSLNKVYYYKKTSIEGKG